MGPGFAIVLIVLTPLLWALPISLLVSELSSMMPEQGGYYAWVRRALGRFWSFQEGWWTLCFSAVDLAIYPILFVTYLSYFFPALTATDEHFNILRWGICLVFIATSVALNLRGSRFVGMHSLFEIVVIGIPFLLLIALGLHLGDWQLPKQALIEGWHPQPGFSPVQLAAGLAIVVWNYSGWDNVSTYADEVHEPERAIPKALGFTLVLVTISYLLPMLIGFKATILAKDWSETSGWPEIGSRLVGSWLGVLMAVAAAISAWALFNCQLLYISRLPAAMAKDGLLPKVFAKTSGQNSVPSFSLITAALVAACFCGLSLGKLMVLDILLYALGLSLEFVALIVLRIREPHAPRPFRIPLSTLGLVAMATVPMLIALTVAVSCAIGDGGGFFQIGIVAAVVIIGLLMHRFANFGRK